MLGLFILLLSCSIHQVSSANFTLDSLFGKPPDGGPNVDYFNIGRQKFAKKFGIPMKELVWNEDLVKKAENAKSFAYQRQPNGERFMQLFYVNSDLEKTLTTLNETPEAVQSFFQNFYESHGNSLDSLGVFELLIPEQTNIGCAIRLLGGIKCFLGPVKDLTGMRLVVDAPTTTTSSMAPPSAEKEDESGSGSENGSETEGYSLMVLIALLLVL